VDVRHEASLFGAPNVEPHRQGVNEYLYVVREARTLPSTNICQSVNL
jgi:hypothetical protein